MILVNLPSESTEAYKVSKTSEPGKTCKTSELGRTFKTSEATIELVNQATDDQELPSEQPIPHALNIAQL